jgi:hypothetical protein
MTKTLMLILSTLAISGCAHNQAWVAPAVVGAVVGVAIHESVSHPQPRVYHAPPPVYHPQPRVYHHPQRVPYCYQTPAYNRQGRWIGNDTVCR